MPATKTKRPVNPRHFTIPARTAKQAAGDVQTFENSLATIGRGFLAPKAPGLFKHEIGFQVLDSDDDNSRAVGIFGFRIGRRLLYVPLFYRDGVFKGTEQLRDPKRKSCVPLSDNWVNKYLSEQGDHKPEVIDRSSNRGISQPSLWQLKYPPSKYASAGFEPDELRTIRRDIAGAISRKMDAVEKRASVDFDLIKFAVDRPALFAAIGELAATYSWFGDALEKFHGVEKVAAAFAIMESRESAKRAAVPIDLFGTPIKILPDPIVKKAELSTLTVVRSTTVGLRRVGKPGGPKVEAMYDPREWEDLSRGENSYKDDRAPEMKSKVTMWLGGNLPDGETLYNPSENGIYEVLVSGHKYEKCVVLLPLIGWAPSIGRCLVVSVSGGKWCYTHPNAVWVRGQADQPALGKWVDALPQVKDDVEGVPEGMCAGVARVTAGEQGSAFAATVPFDQGKNYTYVPANPDSKRPYWAPFNPWEDRTDNFRGKAVQGYGKGPTIQGYGKGPTIHDSSRDDKSDKRVEVFDEADSPRVYGNQLYLPKGCHIVKLDGDKLRPADGSDPERVLFSRSYEAGDKKVAIEKNAYSCDLLDPRTGSVVKYAAVSDLEADLVELHGLSVEDAKKAAFHVSKHKSVEMLVKYAEAYKSADGRMPNTNLALNFPNSPTLPFDLISSPANFADDIVPSETSSRIRVAINDMQMQPGAMDRHRIYPTEQGVLGGLGGIGNSGDASTMRSGSKDLDAVADAVRSGRRDLFDTAAFATLVKHKRLDTLLRETRRNLGAAVTSLGDDLAHLYWNTDEWSERFGEGEIGPLEDQMLSQFEKLGELVLTLQENAARNGPDMSILPEIGPSDNSEQGD